MNARQRAEFEAMLIENVVRKLRLKPYDPRRAPIWYAMTPGERVLVVILSAPYRLREAIARRIRP